MFTSITQMLDKSYMIYVSINLTQIEGAYK